MGAPVQASVEYATGRATLRADVAPGISIRRCGLALTRRRTRHDVEGLRLRALLSVATRDGISVFARGLQALDVELFATEGTREHLAQDGIEVKPVADLTGVPTMLDGQV